jgi:roadblock/LC7 domain-containing protein
VVTETGERVRNTGGGIAGGLFVATLLMLVFRLRYPRWWFDFARELTRFEARISAYLALLMDRYPSTVEEQAVHLEIDYPDVERHLDRWLPVAKWLLALPHYLVLIVPALGAVVAVVVAWFAILFT